MALDLKRCDTGRVKPLLFTVLFHSRFCSSLILHHSLIAYERNDIRALTVAEVMQCDSMLSSCSHISEGLINALAKPR
jgi:hypothetical protein